MEDLNLKKFANDLWKKNFGNKDVVKDFTGTYIVKEEFNTGKRYSWNLDKYDENFQEYYIANELFILQRNSQESFSFNNVNYFVDSDETGNFFNSKDLLLNVENIKNIDSSIKNDLDKTQSIKYSALIITLKMIKPQFQNIVTNYFFRISKSYNFVNIFCEKDVDKLIIKILFNEDVHKTLDLSLIFSSSLPLLMHRISKKFKEEPFLYNDYVLRGKFFNIFVLYFESKENFFVLNSLNNTALYLLTFENLIFVTENSYLKLQSKIYSPNDFSLPLEISPIIKLYSFDYANKSFVQYLKNIKREDNKK
ncbi:hypothetical protein [[Mycoplasma] mobile]|nr:hypothetical protein [[Mycoplasma] mobile]